MSNSVHPFSSSNEEILLREILKLVDCMVAWTPYKMTVEQFAINQGKNLKIILSQIEEQAWNWHGIPHFWREGESWVVTRRDYINWKERTDYHYNIVHLRVRERVQEHLYGAPKKVGKNKASRRKASASAKMQNCLIFPTDKNKKSEP